MEKDLDKSRIQFIEANESHRIDHLRDEVDSSASGIIFLDQDEILIDRRKQGYTFTDEKNCEIRNLSKNKIAFSEDVNIESDDKYESSRGITQGYQLKERQDQQIINANLNVLSNDTPIQSQKNSQRNDSMDDIQKLTSTQKSINETKNANDIKKITEVQREDLISNKKALDSTSLINAEGKKALNDQLNNNFLKNQSIDSHYSAKEINLKQDKNNQQFPQVLQSIGKLQNNESQKQKEHVNGISFETSHLQGDNNCSLHDASQKQKESSLKKKKEDFKQMRSKSKSQSQYKGIYSVKFFTRIKPKLKRFITNYTTFGRTRLLSIKTRNFINDLSDFGRLTFQGNLGKKIVTLLLNILEKLCKIIRLNKIPLIDPESKMKILVNSLIVTYNCFFMLMTSIVLIFDAHMSPEIEHMFHYVALGSWITEMIMEMNTVCYHNNHFVTDRKVIIQIYAKEYFFFEILPLIFEGRTSSNALINLFKLIMQMLLYVHLVACCWNLVIKIEQHVIGSTITWIDESRIDSEHWYSRYLLAQYWAFSVMMNVTTIPTTPLELGFTSFVMLISCIAFGYLLSTVSAIISDISKQQQDYKKDLNILNSYMKRKKVDLSVKRRVNIDLKTIYQQKSKDNFQEEKEVLQKLSSEMFYELNYQANSRIIKQFPFFFKMFSEQTINRMYSIMEEEVYAPQQTVVISSSELNSSCLYLIIRGQGNTSFEERLHQMLIFNLLFFSVNLFVEHFIAPHIESQDNPQYFQAEEIQDEYNEEDNLSEQSSSSFKQIVRKTKTAEDLPGLKKNLGSLHKGQIFGVYSFFTGQDREQLEIKCKEFTTLIKVKRQKFLNIIAENSKDFEKFCEVRDKLEKKKVVQEIPDQICYICKSKEHNLDDCNLGCFDKSNNLFFLKYNYSQTQERKSCIKTRKSKSLNSLKQIIDLTRVVTELRNFENGYIYDQYYNYFDDENFDGNENDNDSNDQDIDQEEVDEINFGSSFNEFQRKFSVKQAASSSEIEFVNQSYYGNRKHSGSDLENIKFEDEIQRTPKLAKRMISEDRDEISNLNEEQQKKNFLFRQKKQSKTCKTNFKNLDPNQMINNNSICMSNLQKKPNEIVEPYIFINPSLNRLQSMTNSNTNILMNQDFQNNSIIRNPSSLNSNNQQEERNQKKKNSQRILSSQIMNVSLPMYRSQMKQQDQILLNGINNEMKISSSNMNNSSLSHSNKASNFLNGKQANIQQNLPEQVNQFTIITNGSKQPVSFQRNDFRRRKTINNLIEEFSIWNIDKQKDFQQYFPYFNCANVLKRFSAYQNKMQNSKKMKTQKKILIESKRKTKVGASSISKSTPTSKQNNMPNSKDQQGNYSFSNFVTPSNLNPIQK